MVGTFFHDLAAVAQAVAQQEDAALSELQRLWRPARARAQSTAAPPCADAALRLGVALQDAARSRNVMALRARVLTEPERAVLGAWAEAACAGADLRLAPLLVAAGARDGAAAPTSLGARWLVRAARARLAHGPLLDAINCLPLTGDSAWILDREGDSALARLEFLMWQLGALAESSPSLARWLATRPAAFDRIVIRGARGGAWQRAVAARALEAASDWFEGAAPGLEDRVERTAAALALHPEPTIWIPAACALGRLSGYASAALRRLFQWAQGDGDARIRERRRAVTALAAAPPSRGTWLARQVETLLAHERNPHTLAALGPAAPWLAAQKRELWEAVVRRLRAPGGAASDVWWSITQGLTPLVRRGDIDPLSESVLRQARALALREQPRSAAVAQQWWEVRCMTQRLAGESPYASDALGELAEAIGREASGDRDEAARRMRQVERDALVGARTAWTAAQGHTSPAARGEELAAVESYALALAFAPWHCLARVRGAADGVTAHLRDARDAAWQMFADGVRVERPDFDLHRVAFRCLGALVDGTDGPARDDGATCRGLRSRTALQVIHSIPWLRVEPTTRDQKRDLERFDKSITDLAWRALDVAQGQMAGDAGAFRRFAAWWALSVHAPHWLAAQARIEPLARGRAGEGAVALAADLARSLHEACTPVGRVAALTAAFDTVARLGCDGTALAQALRITEEAFQANEVAQTARAVEEARAALYQFALAASALAPLLASPDLALGPPDPQPAVDEERAAALDEATLGATANAVTARIAADLGPVCGPLLDAGLTEALKLLRGVAPTTPSFPPGSIPRTTLGRFELVERLGGDGMGEVWIARELGQQRRFVLKCAQRPDPPPSEAVWQALRDAIVRDGQHLASFHHPNIAGFFHAGVDEPTGEPFVVLEYLPGVDLGGYAEARPLTLAECKPIVAGVCAALRALHRRGIVHCDVKPANVMLRLEHEEPADGRFRFIAGVHRDPAKHPVLSAVLIDFGIARAASGAPIGEGAVGTLGFLSPEQSRGEPWLTPASDVYGLAATVYAALTGRSFFDDRANSQAMLAAHMLEHPLADNGRTADMNPALATLLIEATALAPGARPSLDAFARRFETLTGPAFP